jgi:hypothetical protein
VGERIVDSRADQFATAGWHRLIAASHHPQSMPSSSYPAHDRGTLAMISYLGSGDVGQNRRARSWDVTHAQSTRALPATLGLPGRVAETAPAARACLALHATRGTARHHRFVVRGSNLERHGGTRITPGYTHALEFSALAKTEVANKPRIRAAVVAITALALAPASASPTSRRPSDRRRLHHPASCLRPQETRGKQLIIKPASQSLDP